MFAVEKVRKRFHEITTCRAQYHLSGGKRKVGENPNESTNQHIELFKKSCANKICDQQPPSCENPCPSFDPRKVEVVSVANLTHSPKFKGKETKKIAPSDYSGQETPQYCVPYEIALPGEPNDIVANNVVTDYLRKLNPTATEFVKDIKPKK
jgi:hypothetical protein